MPEANILLSIGFIFIIIKILNKHNVMKDLNEGKIIKSKKDCLIEDYGTFIIFKNKNHSFKSQMTIEEFYLANPKLKKIKVVKKEIKKQEPIKKHEKELSLKDKVKKDINEKYELKKAK